MFKLKLPFPPSVNTYWRHVGNRVLVSKKGRLYRAEVVSLLRRKNIQMLKGELIVDIRLVPPDHRRRDIDNSLKALLDAMQVGGVYQDDAQISRLTIEKLEPEPDDPCVEVVVHELPSPINKAGFRTCLRCDMVFESSGPGNRICQKCSAKNSLLPKSIPIVRGRKYHNGELMDFQQEDLL
jgi:crossover junction endodeoxyribonuclease RusA